MKEPVFTGSGVAIVTPFTEDKIDFDAFAALIDMHLQKKTDAIIICGTTGEASTLSDNERRDLISFCVREVNGKIPVIAGTGSNSTARAIVLSQEAEELGADGLLVVTPYYNKTTQQGLQRHYKAIASAVALPVILYNVPGRTGLCCTAETYAALAETENIVGVKEASGNFDLIQRTRVLCPEDFTIWSGNDEDTATVCLLGGKGVISTAANVIPEEMHELCALCAADRFREAGELQLKLKELISALFCEINPIPVKTALQMMGLCSGELRLPLCEMASNNRQKLRQAMTHLGLL